MQGSGREFKKNPAKPLFSLRGQGGGEGSCSYVISQTFPSPGRERSPGTCSRRTTPVTLTRHNYLVKFRAASGGFGGSVLWVQKNEERASIQTERELLSLTSWEIRDQLQPLSPSHNLITKLEAPFSAKHFGMLQDSRRSI